ncbi:acyclic terpene utilization AtuA family protein [Brevibacterium atlanticum]|uniref:acyclic terpene utilization AtuA family protein n=1 Tax=Brevibacterium atlanticum TaxID=2697563 RepID=UPI001D18D016|nr:acyclic terpene utilization AtuA family protein [Brevibacterium atlanticum]
MDSLNLSSLSGLSSSPKPKGHVRVGAGAGFAGDRLDPAIALAEYGQLDYLVFELLGERTVAAAQRRERVSAGTGFDPTLVDRIVSVARQCEANDTRIVTNGGAANPKAAAIAVADAIRDMGVNMTVAYISGDDVLGTVEDSDPVTWETGQPASASEGELISANAYLGSEPIRRALDSGAHIVITGRVADPSLYVGALAHHFRWDLRHADLIGRATVVGHLLECAGQVTGGYFADPVTKPVNGLAWLGFPFADVDSDAQAVIGKLDGTGGEVSARTCTEQLLYEVADPAAYITPDVTADFSHVRFEQLGDDRVRVSGGTGGPRPTELKVTLGYDSGWQGEGQITYSGPRSRERAELAASIVRERLSALHDVDPHEIFTEYIGMAAAFRGLLPVDSPAEVRLRIVGNARSQHGAAIFGDEVEALYTNGPAGGGGARKSVHNVISVKSCSLPRTTIEPSVSVNFIGGAQKEGTQ